MKQKVTMGHGVVLVIYCYRVLAVADCLMLYVMASMNLYGADCRDALLLKALLTISGPRASLRVTAQGTQDLCP